MRLCENIIPNMAFLEQSGCGQEAVGKCNKPLSPCFLCHNRQKMMTTMDFLYEKGLSAVSVGNILTGLLQGIEYGREDKLWPTA